MMIASCHVFAFASAYFAYWFFEFLCHFHLSVKTWVALEKVCVNGLEKEN